MSSRCEKGYAVEDLIPHLKSDGITMSSEEIEDIKAGDKFLMNDIGVLYYNKKDYKKAMRWYQLAADNDMPTTVSNIGQLYELGQGVPVDYLCALKWYLKAAKLADNYVFYSIGGLFERGLGVPVDKEKAVEWYLKYNENSDFIKRYRQEGNEISDKQREKPLGRMIKEAEDILSNEMQKRKYDKQEKERIIHVADSPVLYDFDNRRRDKKICTLERHYDELSEEVSYLKKYIDELRYSHRKKYERMNDEISLLKHIVSDLKGDRKGKKRSNDGDSLKIQNKKSSISPLN